MQIHRVLDHKGTFFQVLETTGRSQAAVMTLASGKDSGPEEIHSGDQIVYIIEGEAAVTIAGEQGRLAAGEFVIIPAGVQHHLYNKGPVDLFFVTFYAPPQY